MVNHKFTGPSGNENENEWEFDFSDHTRTDVSTLI